MTAGNDITAIINEVPHRFPFLLVDRIVECQPGEFIKALKNVTYNEPFFPGHFPSQPVMPGVLVVEALAQAGVVLGHRTVEAESGTIVYFAGVDRARFKRQVVPGDQLQLEVTLVKAKRRVWRFDAVARVGDEVACSAELMAMSGGDHGP